MNGFVFVSNSTKPSIEKYKSRDAVKLSNVNRPYLQAAMDMGYDVCLGVNRENPENLECELPIALYDAHTYRSLTAFKDNLIAYHNLCKVIKERNIKVIHCNTPIGGVVGRLCGKKYKVEKVIYTAHGFHFYKGAPLFNRTILKWAERIMAHWTDVIITMNKEDYENAQKFKLRKGGSVYFVHGVGINLNEYEGLSALRSEKRIELNLKEDDIALISMGDLIKRKNYETAIRAVAATKNEKLHYFICGKGPEEEALKGLAESLNITSHIHFLGFRSDIKDLLAASDVFLFTTKQEGLPRSMMEAMASGLPCIASRVRGNTDLLENTNGGYLCDVDDVSDYADKLEILSHDKNLRIEMGKNNLKTIKKYSTDKVAEEARGIYLSELKCFNKH